MSGLARRLPRLLACTVPALVALWLGLGVWGYTVDDAFISLRYSWSLAHGDGLVFNIGERVEGFSNPTWVLLLAPFVAAGLDGQLAGKAIGLACHVATAAGVAWGALRVGDRRAGPDEGAVSRAVIAGVAGCLVAWSVPLVNWAVLVLETPLYTTLLAGSFLALLHPHPQANLVAAALAGLAGVSRPEGPLQAAMLGLALVVMSTRAWRPAALWAAGARPAVLVIAPVLAWALFRWFYYGDIVPNTYYHKGGGATLAEVHQYLRPLLTNESVLFVGGAVGLACCWLFDQRVAGALTLLALGHVGFLCRVGGDWMSNQRFASPGLPVLAMALGAGLSAAAAAAPGRAARTSLAIAALAIAALHAAQALPDRSVNAAGITLRTDRDTPPHSLVRSLSGSNNIVAVWLMERAVDGQSLAYSEVGLLRYVTEVRVIDLVGLTDKFMAGATGLDTDGRVAWLQSQRPEWLLLRTGGVPAIRKLRASTWLQEEYEVIPGPKSYLAARRKDVRGATVAEALANLERAVERQPRFAAFIQARDKMAARAAAGQGEELAATDVPVDPADDQ